MNLIKQLEKQNIIAWILSNQIRTERGDFVKFDKHSFMIDPYLDWSPLQGVRKASQCGWSIMTNLKLFFAAKNGIPGTDVSAANVIYTLPSDVDVNSFVPSKTNMLIKNNPVLSDYLTEVDDIPTNTWEGFQTRRKLQAEVDSIQRKRLGNSMIYFKGTKSKTAALMITADLNIHDESDRSDQAIIAEYESRLTTSKYRGRWIFSNPSAPKMPADEMYLNSDQKHWFIKCEACGHWQYLDWYKLSQYEFKSGSMHTYIDDINHEFVCGKCARPISNTNRQRGKWVKKFNDKDVSGYWVSHLMYPWVSPKELLRVERSKSKAYFLNFVMGLPYIGSDVVVDATTIVNNIVLTQVNYEKGKVAMGVDNGDIKHYVIGNEQGIFEVGSTRDWNDIELLIQKYEPVTVIDLNPYPNKPRELAAKYRPAGGHKWRVYCSFYVEETKNYELIEWGDGDKIHMVYPARNQIFDDLVAYIANGNMKFFRPKTYWEEYIKHWETMYRVDMSGTTAIKEEKEIAGLNPGQVIRGVWRTSTGEDHFAHATLYYYVALSKLIAGGGQVLKRSNSTNVIQKELGVKPAAPGPVGEGLVLDGKDPDSVTAGMPAAPIVKRMFTTKKTSKPGSISGNM